MGGILETYRDFLKLPSYAIALTLGEGNTPLIKLSTIARNLVGDFELFAKYEGLNPTGSFKDRGMVAAVSEAVGKGTKTIICASTGNTAAAAAAYAARAGIRAIVLIPAGKIARGKLAAAAMYGARIIEVDGSFDEALELVRAVTQTHTIALVNSVNPYRLEGQKTAAFEICDELGSAPDLLCIPVGNGGNITAYSMGFKEYNVAKNTGLPQILGVQAEGAAPLVIGSPVEKPETIATAIRIGKPARGEDALRAAQGSGGKIISVSDSRILEAQQMLAREGVWVEPASAASLAGLIQEIKNGMNIKGKRAVIVCTGHGLKDPDILTLPDTIKIKPTLSALEEVLI